MWRGLRMALWTEMMRGVTGGWLGGGGRPHGRLPPRTLSFGAAFKVDSSPKRIKCKHISSLMIRWTEAEIAFFFKWLNLWWQNKGRKDLTPPVCLSTPVFTAWCSVSGKMFLNVLRSLPSVVDCPSSSWHPRRVIYFLVAAVGKEGLLSVYQQHPLVAFLCISSF